MCGVTFSPNVNVALWWAERERQRSETESQCVRKSQRKRCLRVSRRTREKVRKKMTERERVKERERRREREAACVRALSWLTAGCYSSWHAAPSSPHTSGVRLAGKRSGRGGEVWERRRWGWWWCGGFCNSVKTFLSQSDESALSTLPPPPPPRPS